MFDLNLKKRRIFTEINITPLTDVALVLLIIFMITAPMIIQSGINVKLPGAVSNDVTPEKNIILNITADGKVYLGNQEITLKDLYLPLAALLAVSQTKIVIINADTAVKHGVVISVMDLARQAGAVKLFESTERKQPEWKK